MTELKIQKITLEEFKLKYKLNDCSGVEGFSLNELPSLMEKFEVREDLEKVCYLIDGKLYVDPNAFSNNTQISKEEVESIVKLHDEFRNHLVDFRECMYFNNSLAYTDKAKVTKIEMDNCVKNAKNILAKYSIDSEEKLKTVCSKFFIPDFTKSIFGKDSYNVVDEIDCGA